MTVSSINHEKMISNGIIHSMNTLIPFSFDSENLVDCMHGESIKFEFGVLVGITGDIKGQIAYVAKPQFFSSVGEAMFGMQVEGEMLSSFTGELANMLSGSLCTYVSNEGIRLDITTPTIMEGNIQLSGFDKGTTLEVEFEGKGSLFVHLLIEKIVG